MRISLKASIALLALAIATPSLAAEKVLGLAAIDLQNSFFVRMKEAGDVAAADYGVKSTWQSAEGSLEKQVSIIENFINQGVSAILIDPIDKNAVIPVIQKATAAGIPVITMGNKVEAGSNYSTLYPDYDNMSMVARALGKSLGGKGEVALLVGSRGNFVSDTREKGFVETLKKEFPDIKVVGIEPTGWDAAKATNAAQTWLTTYPDLKAIGCISDSLCLAADSVASSMGTQLLYGGYDGDAEMKPLIDDGKMVMDVLTGAYRVGYWNIAVAARLANGEKLPQDLYMPTYFVTSDATAAKLKADGLTFEYINTDKEAVEAKNYTEQLGPKVPATAMTLAK
ncbi:LacI family transcriptional regulator [Mesorhizobium sp. M7A.F.Ca.CA.001.09.2.1]|jgi:ribose transport system substrate-binding protein|uniref:Periplasmic binding protein/LacI transcriptional regulator n=12 Tax=Mesorhizobium TaxID=68287 RepID=E8T7M9_MESCW|nr:MULTISPECIES: sugar ABC transporter substrate-binding protein [Mesorhizobium]RUU10793.1 LacI family transcriptional regulator [Mesorhizobium sp. M7A.T.Ca.TU.009.01.3.2]RUV52310.1 LacI family transcriptional regulator [Mesorhizobium sp. M7A.F.Ca.MR.228.00.0.0]RUY57826.1 LacI family transcriptional regulator [Mesorhizobium sp. M7A.F.Ca.CA.001.13.2.1]RUZ85540.1 LacI family transcriptional regulator [Mesorhizobium sp. M7A.F.Ca.US.003.02.2.1]RVA54624.1 LacI family transcriptional regulator [Meso